MLADCFTNPNLSAAFRRGAVTSAQVEDLHLYLSTNRQMSFWNFVADKRHASIHAGREASAFNSRA
jgi:hypothetical protein